MINKAMYYTEINSISYGADYAPNQAGEYPPEHADAINAIADDDPDFLAWVLNKEQSSNRVTRYQIRRGLKEINQLTNVKAVYAALPTDDDIIILWSNDVDFPRNGIFAADLKSRFGLTDANLDNLWTKAAVYKS